MPNLNNYDFITQEELYRCKKSRNLVVVDMQDICTITDFRGNKLILFVRGGN